MAPSVSLRATVWVVVGAAGDAAPEPDPRRGGIVSRLPITTTLMLRMALASAIARAVVP